MTRVVWSDRAEADLMDIGAYWFGHSPSGAADLAKRMDAAAAFLAQTPGAGPSIGGPAVRKWRVRATAYILIYRPVRDGIEIVRVRHVRQDWRPEP